MAEESEAIIPIGAWVLDQACRQLKWQRDGHRLQKVAVNVSAIELAQPMSWTGPPDHRGRRCASGRRLARGHRTSRLTGDLTDAVTPLRAAGVHFALDDFGMSYSSLDYLQRFPVESVKIDRTFVAPMNEDETQRAIVQAILALGSTLEDDVLLSPW